MLTKRMVGKWNKLAEELVEAGTVTAYIRQLDRYMDSSLRGI